MRRIVATALLGVAAATGPALAQTSDPPSDTLRRVVLDTLQVRALRLPTPLDRVPQTVRLVTATDVARTPATTLAELLKKTAAVDIVEYPGLLAGIGLRGFRPETGGLHPRTLVLFDGRPAGAVNLTTFDLGSLERIEILEGPASALYGTNAMGGVVHLVPRRTTGAPRGRLVVGRGSWDQTDLQARGGGRLVGPLDADVDLAFYRQGEDFRIGRRGRPTATKIFPDGRRQVVADTGQGRVRPNTRFDYATGRLRLGAALATGWRAELQGEGFEASDVNYPGDIYSPFDGSGRKAVRRRSADAELRGALGTWTPRLRLFRAWENADYFAAGTPSYVNYASALRTEGGQLQAEGTLGPTRLLAGLDLTRRRATSASYSGPNQPTAPYSPNTRSTATAGFLQTQTERGPLVLHAGLRLDRTALTTETTPLRPDIQPGTRSFTAVNPSFGVRWNDPSGLRLRASAGRAFVAPDPFTTAGLARRAGPGNTVSFTAGNPTLAAEAAWSAEAAVGGRRGPLDLEATFFTSWVDDRITPVRAAFPAGQRPRTADGAEVTSVQTYVNAASATLAGWQWRLTLAPRLGPGTLRLYADGVHYLRTEERRARVSVDASRFAGATNFRPEQVTQALVFGPDTTVTILNVARATVVGGAEWTGPSGLALRLQGRYVGRRRDIDYSDFANISDIELPAFLTWDASAAWPLRRGLRLEASVANLTDAYVYEKRGYPLPGRTFRLRLVAGEG